MCACGRGDNRGLEAAGCGCRGVSWEPCATFVVCTLGCGGPGLGDPKAVVYCLGMPHGAAGQGQRKASRLLRQNSGFSTRQVGPGLTSPSKGNSTSESGDRINDKSTCPHGNVFSSQVRACAWAHSSSKSSRTARRLISIPTSITV